MAGVPSHVELLNHNEGEGSACSHRLKPEAPRRAHGGWVQGAFVGRQSKQMRVVAASSARSVRQLVGKIGSASSAAASPRFRQGP
jgi:hypothetical protein